MIKTFQKAEKLEKLRNQKEPAPVKFSPSKAYIIRGHGNEGNDTFIVPKDCIIVVKGHPAESRLTRIVRQDLQRLCGLSAVILKDPIKYQNEIVKAVGSVLIFTEGMTCPNYQYGLLSKWTPQMNDPSKNNDYIQLGRISGVIDVDTRMMCKNDPEEKLKVYNKGWIVNDELRNDLIEMYNGSVHPTQKDIESIIKSLGPSATLNDFLEDSTFRKSTDMDQLTLLETDRNNNAGRPGVYYNLVCRATEKSDILYKTNGREHQILNGDLLEAGHVNPDLKSVRNQNISEALMRAKALHQYDETSKTPFGMAQSRMDILLHGKNGTGRKRTKRKKNIRKKKTRKHR